MNEEYRLYDSFQHAFNRVNEIEKLIEYLESEISIRGGSITLYELRERLIKDCMNIRRNLLNYFKEKGE